MKRTLLYIMGAGYVVAGINHFWHPETYFRIIPQWIPLPDVANAVVGILEVGLGLMLLLPASRNVAAWGLIVLLIVIFPANIQMAIDYSVANHPAFWLAILRLPLQLPLIWWAYTYTRQYSHGAPAGIV